MLKWFISLLCIANSLAAQVFSFDSILNKKPILKTVNADYKNTSFKLYILKLLEIAMESHHLKIILIN